MITYIAVPTSGKVVDVSTGKESRAWAVKHKKSDYVMPGEWTRDVARYMAKQFNISANKRKAVANVS